MPSNHNHQLTPEEQTAELQKAYDQLINTTFDNLKKTHTKKEYSFNLSEKRRLTQQQLITELAKKAQEDLIYEDVLTRVGIAPDPQTHTLYDATLGVFTVFIPLQPQTEKPLEPQSSKPS